MATWMGADEGPRVRSDHQAVTCQGGERTPARPDSRSRWPAIVPQPALGLPATDAPPVQSTQNMGNMCAGRSRGRGEQRVPDSAGSMWTSAPALLPRFGGDAGVGSGLGPGLTSESADAARVVLLTICRPPPGPHFALLGVT